MLISFSFELSSKPFRQYMAVRRLRISDPRKIGTCQREERSANADLFFFWIELKTAPTIHGSQTSEDQRSFFEAISAKLHLSYATARRGAQEPHTSYATSARWFWRNINLLLWWYCWFCFYFVAQVDISISLWYNSLIRDIYFTKIPIRRYIWEVLCQFFLWL